MQTQVSGAGRAALRARRIAFPVTMVLAGVSVSLLAGNARGVTFQNAGPTVNGDDSITATANPYPLIPVSTIPAGGGTPAGQCVWINTGLNNFITANPSNGTGPTGQGWSYSWAGVAQEAKVEAGINILDYYPYVVTPPAVTTADGTNYPAGAPGELAGAVFNISYTPTVANGAPVLTNPRWIQALTGVRRGTNTGTPPGTPILDTPFNGGGSAFVSQSNLTPFYDPLGSAGTYGANNAFFMDEPVINENEYESNPVASVQFQAVLATVAQTVDANGITQNAITLYGGEWWGFSYSATDVPEPAACVMLMFGAGGLFLRRRQV
ncbi:MAG TPA: PEP-CTERM sorting domain-containing protein [Phycisphaerae bacterium]|nr:PEP-CTERM sorting domain-containing protein [Phycisphaerae bacterium]